jgi:8-oxo-dGTP pyrophosphatase MutT (NUDIX family)
MSAIPFDIATFLDLSSKRLEPAPPAIGSPLANPRGDHDLDQTVPPVPEADTSPAAVLVPIVRRPEATVLLTQRTGTLRQHSGQIAFPGGKVDRADGSPLMAALREGEEEIGLDRRLVTPIGYLDPYITGTGFRIMPVVCVVEPTFKLAINPIEVDDAFEVPLGFLMEPGNFQHHAREFQGRTRRYYAIPFGERYIWGATAGIIRNLYERLYGS